MKSLSGFLILALLSGCFAQTDKFPFREYYITECVYLNGMFLEVGLDDYRSSKLDEYLFRLYLTDPDDFSFYASRFAESMASLETRNDPLGLHELYNHGVEITAKGGFLYFKPESGERYILAVEAEERWLESFASLESYNRIVADYRATDRGNEAGGND